jgi:tetratricopeptide (TPR) repeat protein
VAQHPARHRLILEQQERQLAARSGGGKGVLGLIGGWLKKLAKPKAGEGGRPQFSIAIATMNNDIDGAWTRALAGLLEGRQGIGVTVLPTALQIEPGADQVQAVAAASRARQQLARDESVDLLIWGDVHADGYSLWFSAQGRGDEERPGCFNLFTSLELPGDQEPPAADLLFLAALAAMEPPEERRSIHAMALRGAEVPLQGLIGTMPMAWNLEQQRTALTLYGHALATLAVMDPSGPFAHQAIENYRAALLRLPPGDLGIESGELYKHLGLLLMAMGERSPDPGWLEQAVASFKAAAESIVKARYPLEWGAVQNRLGLALYRLDLATGHSDLLKEAMVAFQSALQAFPRHDFPQRWAEVMHNLAQVLQVYGDQMKSPEVLERAVETARAASELRPRLKVPFDWAASQNTLGTALFMLAKHSRGTVKLDEATGAINNALEVYRQFGATRLAEVTEKNLVHLQKLARTKKPGPAQPVHWFERDDDEKPVKKG